MSLTESQLAMTSELAKSLDAPSALLAQELLSLPVGLHPQVADEVYHARVLGLASKSALDQVRRSPAHYRAWVDGLLERDTTALRLGKAVHRAVLEPEAFARQYVIAPDFGDCRKKENKAARDAWRKDHADSTILDNASGIATLGMIRAIATHPLVAPLVDGSLPEVTLRWHDEDAALGCKGRVDLYRPDLATVVDLKSSGDGSAAAIRRDVWSYGYHRQDAFYRRGLRALGAPVEHFVFVVVENTPPHAVALYELDADAVLRGDDENAKLLATLASCLHADRWPAYPETIQTLQLPPWAA